MATEIDLSNCACCSCCGNTVPTTLYATIDFDWVTGTDYLGVTATLTYNGGTGKWEGTATCNGNSFDVKIWCVSDSWFFDLVIGGTSYGVPSPTNTEGGATLVACDPFELGGLIATNYYADDFPFCGKTGTFPTGDELDSMTLTVIE